MSEDWQSAPLGTVCEIYQPKTISQKEMSDDAAYPVFGANGQIGRYDQYNHEDPQLLITCRGATCGSVNISAPFSWITGNAMVVRPKQPDLDQSFVKYFFRGAIDLGGVITGAAQPQITRKSLAPVTIPLPPLEEQKRIVAVLDKAFAALDRARALAEVNLADAEELFERELTCAFARAEGFAEPRPFAKLCKPLTPKAKIMRKNYLEEGDHPIVSQEADLISGYWNDESALMGLDEPVVVFGDHTRCLKYVDFDFVVGADGTKVLKPHGGIDPLYLYYGLRSTPLAEKGYARHFRFLKEASLPDLGEDEQMQLASDLQKVELKASQLGDEYKAKLDDFDDLRQSILQKAFAGELT